MRFDRPWAVIERDHERVETVLSWWADRAAALAEARFQAQHNARPFGNPRFIVRNMARSLPHGLRAEGAPQ